MTKIYAFFIVLFLVLVFLVAVQRKSNGLGGNIEVQTQEVLPEASKEQPDMLNVRSELTSKEMLPSQTPTDLKDDVLLKQAGYMIEVAGGVWFSSNSGYGLPPCQERLRGLQWFSPSKSGFSDQVLWCLKNEKDQFQWVAK